MKTIKEILAISIFIVGFGSGYLSANPKTNQDTTEILLIGSSYFNYNNLAGFVHKYYQQFFKNPPAQTHP